MTPVLRVELFNGLGPYDCSHLSDFWSHDLHPAPHRDNIPERNLTWGDSKFGFASEAQFRAWFYGDQDLKELWKHNYQLTFYLVPATCVAFGRKQLVFDPTKAIPLAYAEIPSPEEPPLLAGISRGITETVIPPL